MIFLETKENKSGIQVDNGALLNYFSVNKKNGVLSGFVLSVDNDQNLVATMGTLIVHGFRFQVLEATEEITDAISKYQPASSTELQCVNLVINYSSANRRATYTFSCEQATVAHSNIAIEENRTGAYYYRLATFRKANGTVSDFTQTTERVVLEETYTKAESDAKYQTKGDYALKSEIPTDYVTNAALTDKLKNYALASSIPTDYVTSASLTTQLSAYDTASVAAGKYQPKGNYPTKTEMNQAINAAITGALEGTY